MIKYHSPEPLMQFLKKCNVMHEKQLYIETFTGRAFVSVVGQDNSVLTEERKKMSMKIYAKSKDSCFRRQTLVLKIRYSRDFA